MKKWLTMFAGVAVACVLVLARPAAAHDVDGPDDCQKDHIDFGDAPECIPAYPSGVIGKFPTCKAPCTLIGTQEFACPPISSPPGPTGYVMNIGGPGGYWLGCYPTPAGPEGIDTDFDGKVNVGGVGISACAQNPTDCVEIAFGGMPFDQDECYADGSDAGITAPIVFGTCAMSKVDFFTTSCFAAARPVFLNICVDWNEDGDWNDNFQCTSGGGGGVAGCAYEWAVKNAPISLTPGCALMSSPMFLSGPKKGHSWLRISISDNPAPDDYPWNGTVSIGQFYNGETEDYPVEINDIVTPSHGSTWGQLKIRYR
jgi:GEVED domain